MLKKRGFSLIELMVVLLIMSTIMVFAIREYIQHIEDTRITRAKTDLDEISKTVRLYNIREDKSFMVGTFTYAHMTGLIGTYFEKEPPLDPWKVPYRHNPDLGVVYSLGPDGIDGYTASSTDDVRVWYSPSQFFMTKAEYSDANQNNVIDYGDYIELTFSRPAQMNEVTAFDFVTSKPERALGSAIVRASARGQTLQIVFGPPMRSLIRPGETTIKPRNFLESIKDFSNPPVFLDSSSEIIIQRKRM